MLAIVDLVWWFTVLPTISHTSSKYFATFLFVFRPVDCINSSNLFLSRIVFCRYDRKVLCAGPSSICFIHRRARQMWFHVFIVSMMAMLLLAKRELSNSHHVNQRMNKDKESNRRGLSELLMKSLLQKERRCSSTILKNYESSSIMILIDEEVLRLIQWP